MTPPPIRARTETDDGRRHRVSFYREQGIPPAVPHVKHLARFELHPAAAELTPRVFSHCAGASGEADFLRDALAEIAEKIGSARLALMQQEAGTWRELAAIGLKKAVPDELLADAADQGVAASRDWSAAALDPSSSRIEVLAALKPQHELGDAATTIDALAALLGTALDEIRRRSTMSSRVSRLETLLELAADWQTTHDMPALLEKIAVASTKLLDAERATIFLWDRPTKTLIGRPALGVPGGELRIPDSTGVVGQVVHSGEARRVGAREEVEIDRRVDEKLKFRTRMLVCVPLRGAKGETIGAFEVLNKRAGEFTDEDEAALVELASHAAIALQNTEQRERLVRTRDQLAEQASAGAQMIGESPTIATLRGTIERVARTDLAVLILGENGTGKEVAARSIHFQSPRRKEPFVAVNCAALTETLLESELFGHEKGAFTDARETRAGKFELAGGGTLFLDEIGDMSLGGQAKLLRVLEEKIVVRVGGSTPIHTAARVVAATNQDLVKLVREKRFREDLYFRLNVVVLDIPPLRARGDDALLLAERFLETFSAQARRKPLRLTAAARKRLLGHSWPGNIRELRNMMERLAYLAPNDSVDAADLAFTLSPKTESSSLLDSDLPLADATHDFQVQFIKTHIDRARGNMTDAARRLGLHRTNLYRKMKQLGMNTTEDDDSDD